LARVPGLFAFLHSIWSLFPATGSALMRTDAAKAMGFADANSGEDWVLGMSLVLRGRVILETRPGRIYRREVGSLWETQRSASQLARHARAVRERIRRDPESPQLLRFLLPVIALLQLTAVRVVRPLVEIVRAR
jgi:hypothetical protein